jgi:hypothetical protein
MVAALETALDARWERIIVSESRVNWAKWTGVVLLASLTLLAIAFVHSENRATTAISMRRGQRRPILRGPPSVAG